MLAYVFWHRARSRTSAHAYETALGAFHTALHDAPPVGFRSSAVLALDQERWLPWSGPTYEDWYLVDDWNALGTLNSAAVSVPRQASHAVIASLAQTGTGAIYELRLGGERLESTRFATWFAKPPGMRYEQLWRLVEPVAVADTWAVLERQLVVGPAPEFCVLGPEPPRLHPSLVDAVPSSRRAIWHSPR
jgi:hypothetical protein